MSKMCCEDFKWRYETNPEMGLNIRCAKLLEDSKPTETSFFITEGYSDESTKVKFCKINYCPFCGKKLSKFFSKNVNIVNARIEDFAKL